MSSYDSVKIFQDRANQQIAELQSMLQASVKKDKPQPGDKPHRLSFKEIEDKLSKRAESRPRGYKVESTGSASPSNSRKPMTALVDTGKASAGSVPKSTGTKPKDLSGQPIVKPGKSFADAVCGKEASKPPNPHLKVGEQK